MQLRPVTFFNHKMNLETYGFFSVVKIGLSCGIVTFVHNEFMLFKSTRGISPPLLALIEFEDIVLDVSCAASSAILLSRQSQRPQVCYLTACSCIQPGRRRVRALALDANSVAVRGSSCARLR